LWIGRNYSAGYGGRRILIVAESVPSEAGAFRVGRGLRAELVEGYIRETVKLRLFTDLVRLILGAPVERAECAAFLNAVAFAHLPLAPTGPRGVALESDFAAVPQRLDDLVRLLEPEAILALGERLCASTVTWKNEHEPSDVEVHTGVHPSCEGYSFREHIQETAALRATFQKL
jgi:hypothetical protein